MRKGTEFFPSMESTGQHDCDHGQGTPLKETAAKADEIIDRISDIDDIETIGAMAGVPPMSMGGSSTQSGYHVSGTEGR